MENTLHYGDNLTVLREHIHDACIDLVYLDPPFNSQADYNVLFKEPTGSKSSAQIEAFKDTWHWSNEAESAVPDVVRGGRGDVAVLLESLVRHLGKNDLSAYLAMMTVRLVELHRVLKSTGSLYLHCDPAASHYLKVVLDSIFGGSHFRSEIVWKRTSAHNSTMRYGPVHDVILFYTKTDSYRWNPQFLSYRDTYTEAFYRHVDASGRRYRTSDLTGAGVRHGQSGEPWRGINPTAAKRHWALPKKLMEALGITYSTVHEGLEKLDAAGLIAWPARSGVPQFKRYLDSMQGVALQDVIDDIAPIGPHAKERLGYPTQKPLALLKRLIEASSNEGDVVLDPFCGCGTAIHAAELLRRRWIGIDITHLAISLIERRLRDAFPEIEFQVAGTPRDVESARALAGADKYQFQWWAVSLVGAQPYGGRKKGADAGIDGRLYFRPDPKTLATCVVSVKGGEKVGVEMIRDLRGVMAREGAPVGLFITLSEPTAPMRREAADAGVFQSEFFGDIPALQIFTIAQLLDPNGPRPKLVGTRDGMAFKRAEREVTSEQREFNLEARRSKTGHQ